MGFWVTYNILSAVHVSDVLYEQFDLDWRLDENDIYFVEHRPTLQGIIKT